MNDSVMRHNTNSRLNRDMNVVVINDGQATIKRGRGRPRKYPNLSNGDKNVLKVPGKRGRKPKERCQTKTINEGNVKRGRGRPRKIAQNNDSLGEGRMKSIDPIKSNNQKESSSPSSSFSPSSSSSNDS